MEKEKTGLEIMQEMCNDNNNKIKSSNCVTEANIKGNVASVTFRVDTETVINIDKKRVSAFFIDEEEFVKYENKGTEEIASLKRLTTMTIKEFREIFNLIGFSEELGMNHISKLTNLYELHLLLAQFGNFDTYQKLIDRRYDVTFLMDRSYVKLAERFNRMYEIGDEVTYVLDFGEEEKRIVKSKAWIVGDIAVALFEGFDGGRDISRVKEG
jgi:hypothetical protein